MLEHEPLSRTKTTALIRGIAVLLPVMFVTLLLTLTVFAKNTYLINDGDRVLIHTTYTTDPVEVLNEAGLSLDEDDIYTTQPGPGVSEITVQRRQAITLIRNGQTTEVFSYGETVEQLLERMELELTAEDYVSQPLNAETYDGMELVVSRAIRMEQTYTSAIPFETVYCQDPSIPEGEEVVLTAGVQGSMSHTDVVYYAGGEEVNRIAVSQTITSQPVNALVAVGTGAKQPNQGGTVVTACGQTLEYTRKLTVKASAYSRFDEGCDDYTATGTFARYGVVAVDPSVIPMGSKLYIVSNDGVYIYGVCAAEDTGGSIKGDRIDLCFDSVQECLMFGRRDCTVYVLAE